MPEALTARPVEMDDDLVTKRVFHRWTGERLSRSPYLPAHEPGVEIWCASIDA